jgi:hypothetical protein
MVNIVSILATSVAAIISRLIETIACSALPGFGFVGGPGLFRLMTLPLTDR